MTTNRVNSANDPQPRYRYAGGGTRLIVTRKRPGVVTLTTPGDHHVLIDHVSYYLDAEVEILGTGEKRVTRWHLVYRFGSQSDPLPSFVPAEAEQIALEALDAVLEGYAAEIGVVALDGDDAADRLLAADLTRQVTQLRSAISTKRAKAAGLLLEATSVESTLLDIERELGEVRTRIDARSATPSA